MTFFWYYSVSNPSIPLNRSYRVLLESAEPIGPHVRICWVEAPAIHHLAAHGSCPLHMWRVGENHRVLYHRQILKHCVSLSELPACHSEDTRSCLPLVSFHHFVHLRPSYYVTQAPPQSPSLCSPRPTIRLPRRVVLLPMESSVGSHDDSRCRLQSDT